MKILIIFFSHTGHTRLVVDKVVDGLQNQGHLVTTFELQTVQPLDLSPEEVEIKDLPDVSPYGHIILGTPVHGGRMSAPLRRFLREDISLDGTSASVLLTHFFRKGWGAAQTIQVIRRIIEDKGATYMGAVNVKWFSLFRKIAVSEVIDALAVQINSAD